MNYNGNREAAIAAFLQKAGWSDARQDWLGQDASTRRYARLSRNGQTALLMDAPPIESGICTPEMTAQMRAKTGWNALSRLAASRVDAFALIASFLRKSGLAAPEVYTHDTASGLALIEDFGPGREIARVIERGEADERALYRQAASTLAQLHRQTPPQTLSENGEVWTVLPFDAVALAANADLYADWLHRHDPRARMRDTDRARWERVRDNLIERAAAFPRDFTLRDYHAENLLVLENGRIGLLDFQDAVLGWDAWDMAMLVQDARRVVSADAERAAIKTYLDETGKPEEAFQERLAVIGTLNALRITGVFARLIERDHKPRYGEFMPRQQRLLAQNLRHPDMSEMAAFIGDVSPFILEGR